MHHPSNGLTGAVRITFTSTLRGCQTMLTHAQVVAIYIAGEAAGSILQILIADKLGRIRFMQLASFNVTVGVAIQTASVNIGMLLAGRFIAGVGVGYVPKCLSSVMKCSWLNASTQIFKRHDSHLSFRNQSSQKSRIDWWSRWRRPVDWNNDGQLGWVCRKLCSLWQCTVAPSSGSADSLGHYPLPRTYHIHA